MNINSVLSKHILKNGKELTIIRPDASYAEKMVEFIKTVDEESPFLGRESRDQRLTVDEMRNNLETKLKSKTDEFCLGLIDGEIAVEFFVMPVAGTRVRFAHRSKFGLVVLKKYWGIGIGRIAVTKCIELSKQLGYEQLELNTCVENKAGISLYESLGFKIYGSLKNAMKYEDGSYADEYLMVIDN